jgi:hypothetical protein
MINGVNAVPLRISIHATTPIAAITISHRKAVRHPQVRIGAEVLGICGSIIDGISSA